MKKQFLVILLIIVLLCAGWVADLLWSAGQFKKIDPHFKGTCSPVAGVVGAEDITIHPGTGIAYISACDRRAVNAGRPGKGGIFAYDLNMVRAKPVNLTPDAGEKISGSSVGAVFGDRMLIGSVFDTKMLDCRIE